jgi:hypothetical protein
MSEPKERKARDHGETWERARRLYLKYPLLPASDIARILRVSRQAIDEYVRDLKPEREERHAATLASIKRKEGL